jgi:hypothetical protein
LFCFQHSITMQLLNFAALSVLVATAFAAPPQDLEKRGQIGVYLCEDTNWKGHCEHQFETPGKCRMLSFTIQLAIADQLLQTILVPLSSTRSAVLGLIRTLALARYSCMSPRLLRWILREITNSLLSGRGCQGIDHIDFTFPGSTYYGTHFNDVLGSWRCPGA